MKLTRKVMHFFNNDIKIYINDKKIADQEKVEITYYNEPTIVCKHFPIILKNIFMMFYHVEGVLIAKLKITCDQKPSDDRIFPTYFICYHLEDFVIILKILLSS